MTHDQRCCLLSLEQKAARGDGLSVELLKIIRGLEDRAREGREDAAAARGAALASPPYLARRVRGLRLAIDDAISGLDRVGFRRRRGVLARLLRAAAADDAIAAELEEAARAAQSEASSPAS